jgi:hypothetical protein
MERGGGGGDVTLCHVGKSTGEREERGETCSSEREGVNAKERRQRGNGSLGHRNGGIDSSATAAAATSADNDDGLREEEEDMCVRIVLLRIYQRLFLLLLLLPRL